MTRIVLFCTDTFWDEHGDDIVSADPTVEIVRLVEDDHVTQSDLERITAAFFSPDVWPGRVRSFIGACRRAPRLQWMHTFFAGTDDPMFAGFRDRNVTITTGSGASAPSIAQTVMLYLLGLSRDLPRLMREQTARRWDPRPSTDLAGLRLGIVGLGAIGSEVARLASAFEMEVTGIRRRVVGDEPCRTWTDDRLPDLLRWADVIAVTAPLTDATRGLFDAVAFATMRPGSWFVNVGRGEIVDEPALIDALASGHLGGAGLDVFVTEPLPSTSPLWAMPNVIITPHSSGVTKRSHRRSVDIFIDNFGRHTRDEPLLNIAEHGFANP
jgi:phosphoglycerate dehydrogenase-like enzyme